MVNFIECHVCNNLFINISGHYQNIHKITDPYQRLKYVIENKVVPKCLTKIVNGKLVKLSGDELNEAEKTNGSSLKEENEL